MSTKSAPNRVILPPKVSVDWGIRSNIKNLPPELLTRKEQKAVLPAFSDRRVLSNAEKDATDWYHRTKELETQDAYAEQLKVQLDLPNISPPQRAKDVRVVNLADMTVKVERCVNDGVAPTPPAAPQPPPITPPSRRHGYDIQTQTDDVAVLQPDGNITTTSTRKMKQTAEAATSAIPTTATGSTQTDEEPRTGGNLNAMATDAPLQQIVHNYHIQQHHQQDIHHNVVNQLNQEFNYNTYLYNQTTLNVDASHNTVNQMLQQNLMVQAVDNLPTANRHLPVAPDRIVYKAPHRVNFPNRLMIEAPVGQPVAPIHLPLPFADELPAYDPFGDVDMDFAGAPPGAGEGAPPVYPLFRLPQTRGRAKVTKGRKVGTRVAAPGVNIPLPGSTVVSLPDCQGNPASWATYMRSMRATAEPRRRDEGWFMQGLDDVPKPGTKRKKAQSAEDSKRRRVG
ncbi:hypothetical protein HDV00_008976 [Rhizophlyctis rosea]|nr:hypothetical protein HDV00_008976 [Rhizophlyctis rosea]